MISLAEVKPNESVCVKKIKGNDNITKRMMEMGITQGVKIKVKNFAPLGDPIEIQFRGYTLSIRKKDAKNILTIYEKNMKKFEK